MVQICGLALGLIPVDQRTIALCVAAVTQNGDALCFVPPDKLNKTLKRTGLASNTDSIRFSGGLDDDDLLALLSIAPMALRFVKARKQTDTTAMRRFSS